MKTIKETDLKASFDELSSGRSRKGRRGKGPFQIIFSRREIAEDHLIKMVLEAQIATKDRAKVDPDGHPAIIVVGLAEG